VRLLQEILFQEAREPQVMAAMTDLTSREIAILAILGFAVFFIGLYPGPLLDMLTIPVNILTGGAS
jgi:NADH-quinone oxidoreductase subunit M